MPRRDCPTICERFWLTLTSGVEQVAQLSPQLSQPTKVSLWGRSKKRRGRDGRPVRAAPVQLSFHFGA